MGRRNRSARESTPVSPVPPPSQNVTMSETQFQALLAAVSAQAVAAQNISQQNILPVAGSVAPIVKVGDFSKCTSRFSGDKTADVQAFIDAIETYKDCANVSKDNALKGMSMLLTNNAATWWQGVKADISTWEEAIDALRAAFGPKKPPFRLFRDLFAEEQAENESTEMFVCKCRALLAQLPYKLEERTQLDMVYGLLNKSVRKRVSREDFDSFNSLLSKTRSIEESLKDTVYNKTVPVKSDKSSKLSARCRYCKCSGHSTDECSKLQRKRSKDFQGQEVTPSTDAFAPSAHRAIKCYGCGAPGVIRQNCPKCKTTPKSNADFHFVDDETKKKPKLLISILGLNGSACPDTGASRSVASQSLYSKIRDKVTFKEELVTIKLADGSTRTDMLKTVILDVHLKGRKIPTDFLILPDRKDSETLLGADFIAKAGLILDLSNWKWCFADRPADQYSLSEDWNNVPSNQISVVPIQSLEAQNVRLRDDEGNELSEDQRGKLNNLLISNLETFAPGGAATPFAEHQIVLLPDTLPISSPPYKLAGPKLEALRKEIQMMLETDIIEECESPWGAPIVMVAKGEGKWRLCVDYRGLNAVTIGDSYPMPRIDHLLHSAKRTPFMTTLDLRAGYWQISVREEDRDKTTFVTPEGTYRCKRMSFGLKNAPATFQRLIDRFRSGLKDVTIFAYLDDLIILSESFEKHLDDLQKVFTRLQQFSLRVNREKSVFVRPSVKYLGHVITPEGISTNPEKVSAIVNMPPPINLKHLQSFLQTASWYRRFVPNFASIAKPLSDLTKKDAPWVWGKEQQSSFERLKELLTTAPVLQQADETRPYTIRTDASGYAIGAVLLQGEGYDERPIEYISRLLTPTEKNYPTIHREALAVVWALSKFRGYVECSKIRLGTDHQPLKWLMSIKSPVGRLATWALQIQAYDIDIFYTPGKTNVVADMLSRPTCSQETVQFCGICTTEVDFPRKTSESLRQEQLADPEIAKIIKCFESPTPDAELSRWTDQGFLMSGGILYRHPPDSDEEEAQQVVPKQSRQHILEEYHNSPTAGHYGVEKTLQRIAKRYYWTGMRSQVVNHVKSCVDCQRYKPSNLKPAGLLQTPAFAQRFEIIAIDLFGPLPESNRENRWIFIIEDTASRWTELFALREATASACAKTLIEEVFLRYGFPRKIVSDNGVQFVSDVMQQVCLILGIHQSFIPVYHAEANPVERKNRDLKPQLAIMVGNDHRAWDEGLSAIRFAMNTVTSSATGYTPAQLTFGRELRTPDDVTHDMRAILSYENFIPQITPYLGQMIDTLDDAKHRHEKEQARRKEYADRHRRPAPDYQPGDKVLLKTHILSNMGKHVSSKFVPRRDGPYVILKEVSPTSYEVASMSDPTIPIGKFHTSEITPFVGSPEEHSPVVPKRKRGRPKKRAP